MQEPFTYVKIAGIIGIICFFVSLIMLLICGTEYIKTPSLWSANWSNATGCQQMQFVLFWLGIVLFVVPFATMIALSAAGY